MKRIFVRGTLPRKISACVAAIGVFDGVHRGHQKVIRRAVAEARRLGAPSVVVTFHPHPVEVLHPGKFVPYITTCEHRLRLIEACGADMCVVIEFGARIAAQDPESFVRDLLVGSLGARKVIVGRDFHFGRGGKGNISFLQKMGRVFGFQVEALKIIKNINRNIKSTYIKKLIKKGDLAALRRFLSRPYSFLGEVEHGDGRGRRIGYRTANLKKENVVTLPDGIYMVCARLAKKTLHGLCYIGRRPTFKSAHADRITELHLLDHQGDLYGRTIEVSFMKKLRGDRRFSDGKKLSAQIARDIAQARRFFARASCGARVQPLH
jgi:riboflavin kinase / FMN adenylyltransferase